MGVSVWVWIWIALAVANAQLAARKNRSRLNWFIVSLFIGPLATILVRVWPRVPESGSTEWTSGQLVSGGAVALVGALVCAGAAVGLNGGFALWCLCGFYLVGAGAFTWLYARGRAA